MQRSSFFRYLRTVLVVIFVLAVLGMCGFFGLWIAATAGSNRGSPSLAVEWRDRLRPYDEPEAAKAADPEIIVLRFPNGEWVFGLAQSSHGVWKRGGGTLVVKDSKGQIHAFFGHVCGPDGLYFAYSEPRSLADYYAGLAKHGFTEHSFP